MNEKLIKRVQYKYPDLDLSELNHDEIYKLDEMTPTPKEYWEQISVDRNEDDNEEG